MRPIITCVLVLTAISLHAQKMPNVQQVSLRAPSNVKIDGKATEWNDLFQAYNKSVDLFYSIANDDSNLYLVIKAIDKNTIYKIVNGGISFTINTSEKKEDDNKTVTYPKFDRRNFPSVNLDNKPVGKKGVAANSLQTDSFRNAISKNLNDRAKMIGLSSGKGDNEMLIPIYNDLGIKVAQYFDTDFAYVYEISIPLPYLSILPSKIISYNIRLNGMHAVLPKGAVITAVVGGDAVLNAMNPTDFWGDYTLAK